MFRMLLIVAVVGCNRDNNADKDTSTEDPLFSTTETMTETTDPFEPCLVALDGASPDAEENDVFFLDDVWVDLTIPDETATIVVVNEDGNEVPGTVTVEDIRVTWVGDQPLMPLTRYSTLLMHSCGSDEFSWRTSEMGTPISEDVLLDGRTYAFNIANATIVEPQGQYVPLVLTLLEELDVIIQFVGEPFGDAIEVVGTFSYAGKQNRCMPTLHFLSDWANPVFDITDSSVYVATEIYSFALEDFELSGALSPDASRIEGGRLAGWLDTRNLGEVLVLGPEPSATCSFFATMGIACLPCASDGLPYCAYFEFEDGLAREVEFDVEEIAPEDINQNSCG